jgi:hypothetical protein
LELLDEGKGFKKGLSVAPVNDTCAVCAKTVYLTEKLVVDKTSYHKVRISCSSICSVLILPLFILLQTCFKCAECKKSIGVGGYASLEGKIFCKPHFKQLFKLKVGFGFVMFSGSQSLISCVRVIIMKGLAQSSIRRNGSKRTLVKMPMMVKKKKKLNHSFLWFIINLTPFKDRF